MGFSFNLKETIMLSINSNTTASSIANLFNSVAADMATTSKRISSGKRIVSASDDPAGLGIISTMKAQAGSYNAVQKNLSAGQSLLDVASSALNSQQVLMIQMKDVATQAASDTLTADQRTALQATFLELQTQLDQTANNATMFGKNIISSTATTVAIQSGINAGDTYTINTAKSDATTLGVNAAAVDLTDVTKASAAMTVIDLAVAKIATNQSTIGAQQNGLSALIKNATNTQENLDTSISRIEDVDMAAESAKLSQLQAKQQLTTSMLAIANQLPSYILQLIK
jgi:flagellin